MTTYFLPTIADLGREVAEVLAADPPDEDAARRLVFDFASVVDGAHLSERQGLLAEAPDPTGDPRFDALLAALAEHLSARHGHPSPAWVEGQERFLHEWWFVSGLRSLHASALVQSPISFARRGVFICDGALTYR